MAVNNRSDWCVRRPRAKLPQSRRRRAEESESTSSTLQWKVRRLTSFNPTSIVHPSASGRHSVRPNQFAKSVFPSIDTNMPCLLLTLVTRVPSGATNNVHPCDRNVKFFTSATSGF